MDKNFVDGMRFEKPNEKAPEWIKGKISIEVAKLIPWLEANKNERGWVNIDLKKSKNNNLYLQLNTFKKSAFNPKAGEVDPSSLPNDFKGL